jgi:hypothetical protein
MDYEFVLLFFKVLCAWLYVVCNQTLLSTIEICQNLILFQIFWPQDLMEQPGKEATAVSETPIYPLPHSAK